MLHKFSDLINEGLTRDNIEISHRVHLMENPKTNSIGVQFVHVAKRNSVLEKAIKKIPCDDLDFASRSPAMVNEQFCLLLKRRFGATIGIKKEWAWLYAWIKSGKIFARINGTPNVVHIACAYIISQIFP